MMPPWVLVLEMVQVPLVYRVLALASLQLVFQVSCGVPDLLYRLDC
jgi:hypothetical protein